MDHLSPLADESFCYLTTTGRRSGRPHEIEIWFGWQEGNTINLMAGGRDEADWVRNLKASPGVTVRIAGNALSGMARVVVEENEDASPVAYWPSNTKAGKRAQR